MAALRQKQTRKSVATSAAVSLPHDGRSVKWPSCVVG